MGGYLKRLTGFGLALLALVTLLVASFSHVHSVSGGNSASNPLECRLPFTAKGNQECPANVPDHVHCDVCLATNAAAAGLLPEAPILVTRFEFGLVIHVTTGRASIARQPASSFEARGPPRAI